MRLLLKTLIEGSAFLLAMAVILAWLVVINSIVKG